MLRRYWLAAPASALLFVLSLGAGYLTKSDTARPDTSLVTAGELTGTRGTVQSLNGDALRITTDNGPRDFVLNQGAPVEALRPVPASSIAPGDWLNAGAIPNSQNLFTITGLTLISPAMLQDR